MTAWLGSSRRLIEILDARRVSAGRIQRAAMSRSTSWRSILGMEGPVMSASSTPTECPCRRSATARSAETEDLPTPPLPLTTAITWRTQLNAAAEPSCRSGLPKACSFSSAVISRMAISTSSTPSTSSAARRASSWMRPLSGQPIVVSARVNVTRPSATARSWTMPISTMLRCSSGSITRLSASRTRSWMLSTTVYSFPVARRDDAAATDSCECRSRLYPHPPRLGECARRHP